MKEFTIGEVANRTGLAASAIRYYESAGVVPSPPRVSGRRVYNDNWMKWLGIVLLAQEAGFSIEEIRHLVQRFPKKKPPSNRWQKAAGKKIQEIDEKLIRLKKMQELLTMLSTCSCSTLEDCGAAALQYLYVDGTQ